MNRNMGKIKQIGEIMSKPGLILIMKSVRSLGLSCNCASLTALIVFQHTQFINSAFAENYGNCSGDD